ncbi:hypothetical protein CEUSTIGMA_g13853.t1 [Chlamydomonas eustigma]|uniref:Uncharacterized protein n=1 Tax=Chlamydomonas eustigma TaxID=1157962 RepID=A0A250XTV0_9CHLO|nr:hypothetical protein CEUSTIGMA_g13853.t1 [Chlamydomonas eustigma]|eukprot:GAX86443.1 hypothetical protein CEUSTIGMA_g13853.t1 [Chlamydomonas eustigma]
MVEAARRAVLACGPSVVVKLEIDNRKYEICLLYDEKSPRTSLPMLTKGVGGCRKHSMDVLFSRGARTQIIDKERGIMHSVCKPLHQAIGYEDVKVLVSFYKRCRDRMRKQKYRAALLLSFHPQFLALG